MDVELWDFMFYALIAFVVWWNLRAIMLRLGLSVQWYDDIMNALGNVMSPFIFQRYSKADPRWASIPLDKEARRLTGLAKGGNNKGSMPPDEALQLSSMFSTISKNIRKREFALGYVQLVQLESQLDHKAVQKAIRHMNKFLPKEAQGELREVALSRATDD